MAYRGVYTLGDCHIVVNINIPLNFHRRFSQNYKVTTMHGYFTVPGEQLKSFNYPLNLRPTYLGVDQIPMISLFGDYILFQIIYQLILILKS